MGLVEFELCYNSVTSVCQDFNINIVSWDVVNCDIAFLNSGQSLVSDWTGTAIYTIASETIASVDVDIWVTGYPL